MKRTTRHSFSLVLLAVHLVVFLFGGATIGERTAQAARHAAQRDRVVATSSGAIDSPAVVTAEGGRLELGARPRGDRDARGPGGLPLGFLIPSGAPTIAPAALTGSLDSSATTREVRPAPSVVNGARGPPAAR